MSINNARLLMQLGKVKVLVINLNDQLSPSTFHHYLNILRSFGQIDLADLSLPVDACAVLQRNGIMHLDYITDAHSLYEPYGLCFDISTRVWAVIALCTSQSISKANEQDDANDSQQQQLEQSKKAFIEVLKGHPYCRQARLLCFETNDTVPLHKASSMLLLKDDSMTDSNGNSLNDAMNKSTDSLGIEAKPSPLASSPSQLMLPSHSNNQLASSSSQLMLRSHSSNPLASSPNTNNTVLSNRNVIVVASTTTTTPTNTKQSNSSPNDKPSRNTIAKESFYISAMVNDIVCGLWRDFAAMHREFQSKQILLTPPPSNYISAFITPSQSPQLYLEW